MKSKLLGSLAIIVLIGTLCLVATSGQVLAAETKHKIGIMPFHTPCMWFDPFTAGGYWYLTQHGHEVIVQNAEWNTKKMNTILKVWAEDPKLEGVIVAPLGGQEVLPGIKALRAAGKTVVLSNNDAGNCPEADFCVRFDSKGECAKGAELIVKLLTERYGKPEGQVILGLGDVRNTEHIQRADGVREVFAKYPDIKVKEFVSDMDAGKAATQAGTLLRTMPKVDAMFSVGMLEFMGMINALKRENMAYKLGNPKHVILVGMDSCPDVINPAVKEGLVDLVIDQPVLSYNAIAAYYLIQILDQGKDSLPKPGTVITAKDIDVTSKVKLDNGQEVTVPSDSWSPMEVLDTIQEKGQIWFKTNGAQITAANVDDPTLWSVITGQIKKYGWQ